MQKGFRKVKKKLQFRRWYFQLLHLFKGRPDQPATMSPYGVWLHPNTDDLTYQLYLVAEYGYVFSNFLRDQTAPFVFLDIGANQGLYALLADKNPNCTKAFAFEPVPDTAAVLSQNIALNQSQKITLVQKAISEHSGQTQIYTKDAHSGAASLRSDVLDSAGAITIDTINADDLGPLLPADAQRFIVKIDVEGHEETVLHQLMTSSAADKVAAIYYECDERWANLDAIRDMLKSKGFNTFQRVGDNRHYNVLAQR